MYMKVTKYLMILGLLGKSADDEYGDDDQVLVP